jgi:hypothetical protein
MRIYLADAIKSLRPNSEFSFTNNDYSTIQWVVLEGEAPTQEEIDAEIIKIKEAEIIEAEQKATARQAVLDRLGITAEEAQLILGGSN